MIIHGMSAHSRGTERVYVHGDWTRRAVYVIDGQWRFFVKIYGEFIEVYHKSDCFSTNPDKEKRYS